MESVQRGLARRAAKMEARRQGAPVLADVSLGISMLGDDTEVDVSRRTVRKGEVAIQLTPAEGHLLKVFIENVDKVFTHRELVLLVQGYDVSQREAQEILRPLVSRLRHKLEPFPVLYDSIVSVRGTGYVFEAKK
jgi:DNA-binding response OmpR family regulator